METTSTIQFGDRTAGTTASRWRMLDSFAAVNVLLDALVWRAVNFDRYAQQMKGAWPPGLFACVLTLVAGLGVLWWWLRQQALPWPLLALAQAALLMHFAGAVIHVDGVRLNALIFLGIRFNKLVIFTCTFMVAWLLAEIAGPAGIRGNAMLRVFVALAAFGVGAGVEIFQYLAMGAALPPEVARFEESLRDLIASLGGAGVWLIFASALPHRFHSPGGDP